MKTIEIVKLFQVLNIAKITNLSLEGKFSIIRTVKRCKEVVDSINTLIEDAKEKLKPENFDQWREMVDEYESLSSEDKAKADKISKEYSNQINACIDPELNKETLVEIEKISQEDFGSLIDQNDWNVEVLVLLNDCLLK